MNSLKHLCLATFVIAGISSNAICHAAKPPGGGGGTASNNVAVTLDEHTGILSITGDGASNMLYVSITYSGIIISPGPWNQTTINGGTGNYSFSFYPVQDVALNFDLAGGNDRLWINITDYTDPYVVHASILAGDGADEIAIFGGEDRINVINGNLTINGGKDDDRISIDNVDPHSSFDISGGDGHDDVAISNVTAFGGVTLNGGRGRDTLTRLNFLPWYGASISGFETLIGP
ncbi:MAG: hypothetical protein JNL58_14470 [Planctomyces sp.]|nr:hypothetical protein [Planctomyces sp.]